MNKAILRVFICFAFGCKQQNEIQTVEIIETEAIEKIAKLNELKQQA